METAELIKLINTLTKFTQETEWVEFKHNFHSPEEIGERISALSNSACLWNKPYGYLIFGIDDTTHEVVGTTFKAKSHKKGNEELEMWLSLRLSPKIDFDIYEFDYCEGKHISLYRIPAAVNVPVEFTNVSYVRVGSLTKKLSMFKDKEAKIWKKNSGKPLNKIFVKNNVSMQEVISLLSVETYFDLMKLPMPTTQQTIIEKFKTEQLVGEDETGLAITELGAILFAKNLADFDNLKRKAVRVIVYKGRNKLETEREQMFSKGYALSFENMVDWIKGQLPANEEIGKALRKEVTSVSENRTTVTLSSYRPLSEINRQERLAACYQHACIKYVSGELMTNQSLRERLGVEQKNYPMVSRIIKDGIDNNLIKEADPENKNRRYVKYIPYWA